MSQGGSARLGGLLVVLALLVAPAAAQAAITVTDTGDSGAGTLREAINQANTSPGADTIDFNVPTPATITLSSGLPAINDDVTIDGPGTTQLTVDANFGSRPFVVNAGKTATISGLTIAHGSCLTVCGGAGGAIYNSGDLTLTNVAVNESNAKAVGGGVYNAASGTLTLNGSSMSHNGVNVSGGSDPSYEGGAIENLGTLHLVLSTLSNNTVSANGFSGTGVAYGGGVMNAGTMTMDRSTLTANSATVTGGTNANAHGGAIQNSGTLELRRSTIDHNHANTSAGSNFNGAFGGGIGNINPASPADVTVTLDRVTLSDNSAIGASESFGGGIESYTGTYTITSSTIANNSAMAGANGYGGGASLKNSIISYPSGGGANCSGAFSSEGYNLSDDSSCGLSGIGDQEGVDPMLAASLASNGGATQTYALQSGSPAIDRGKASTGETVDQRGQNRPEDLGDIPNATGGDGSDIGAFEVQDTTPPDTVIDSGPSGVINDPTPTFTFHSTEAGSSFRCDTGGLSGFTPCTSPKTTQHLADGQHTFAVKARDPAGNLDPSPATRSFTVKTAEVKRSGSTLMITAAPGATDNFVIKKTSATQIQVTDLAAGAYSGSGIHTGLGCARSGDYTANCNAGPITAIKVASGAGTDRIRNATALRSFVNGGGDDDALFGGTQADQLTGGPGVDAFQGGRGNDVLLARDLTADGAVNCDGGTKPGGSDQAILDKLPKDSSVSGCEVVSRH